LTGCLFNQRGDCFNKPYPAPSHTGSYAPTINAALVDLQRLYAVEDVGGCQKGRVFGYGKCPAILGEGTAQVTINRGRLPWPPPRARVHFRSPLPWISKRNSRTD